ncbi:MAG: nicotinate-nucleotide adenylyltransferase [Bacteroidota bacterium]
MRIGIFGGSFNPPHMGHLIVAEQAREKMGLGKVLFIPAATPPHKQNLDIVEAHHRMEMMECAVHGNRYFEASDIELQRGGLSFTVDTVAALTQLYPEDSLVLLIGADNLLEFNTWREPERILELVDVVALSRPGFRMDGIDTGFRSSVSLCEVPLIDLASSEIRRRVKEGKSIRYMVPVAVESYIVNQGLYLSNQ